MSRPAKLFFGSALGLSASVIWAVHYMQKRESDAMYLGVIKDEARLSARLASALPSLPALSSAVVHSSSPVVSPLPSSASSSSSPTSSASSWSSVTPDHPRPSVQQPTAVMDQDCPTCQISPPPELVEKASTGERRRERELRRVEYEMQRRLGDKLGRREQGVESGVKVV